MLLLPFVGVGVGVGVGIGVGVGVGVAVAVGVAFDDDAPLHVENSGAVRTKYWGALTYSLDVMPILA